MSHQVAEITRLLGPLNDVETKNAPSQLYCAGDPSLLHASAKVSVVGSRKAGIESLNRTTALAAELVKRGIVVVSGLAEGIDTAAHTAAIENGGHTIAVLGTPLNRFYPAKNAELQKKIMRDHLCISQFAPNSVITRSSFPQRNRTMALISHATVIMEAQDDSGSLHQGWEALRLGRPLFIAQSIIENSNVTWPAKFIQYGAQTLPDNELDYLIETLPPRISTQNESVAF